MGEILDFPEQSDLQLQADLALLETLADAGMLPDPIDRRGLAERLIDVGAQLLCMGGELLKPKKNTVEGHITYLKDRMSHDGVGPGPGTPPQAS